MVYRLLFFLNFLFLLSAQAQISIEIPDHIYFAGMKLNLSKSLRTNLAAQVQTIQKNKTFFQAKVSLADMYFPIIERVFVEEDIPLDFKYLAIQESSLQSDVVSTSNAVGYWQFKKESAIEVGLSIDSDIDERKHIVESSRGAARYLKKNYLVMTNWIYALIAYNTGLGGAKSFTNSKYIGVTEMDLDNDLHWYAIKFLAHKLAYEDKVGYGKPDISLLEYFKETKGKTITELASIVELDQEQLMKYNKWALRKKIPEDKDYCVLLPVPFVDREQIAAKLGIDLNAKAAQIKDPATTPFVIAEKPATDKALSGDVFLFTTNNGLNAIIARSNDNVAKLAMAGKITEDKFMQYNEMASTDNVKKGHIYYFEQKKSKAIIAFHTVKAGESLWEIAQLYGVKLSQLKKRNRIEEAEALQTGRLLYLRFKRPLFEPIILAEKPIIQAAKTYVTPVAKILEADSSTLKNNLNKATITIASVNIASLPAIEEPITPKPENVLPISNFSGTDTDTELAIKPLISLKKGDFSLPDSTLGYHLVNQGQTLYSISRYYGQKIDTLKSWNGIGVEGIKIGQKIIISKSKNGLKGNYTTIVVGEGQNISELAKALSTKPADILLWNDKKNESVLVGEVLKIK